MNKDTLRSPCRLAYEAYGYCNTPGTLPSLLGFNGVNIDALTGNYALGNGYRMYNPRLMRFQSSDRLSPFSLGGLNAYAYCLGDPVNQADPSGRSALRRIWQALGGGTKSVASLPALSNTKASQLETEIELTRSYLRRGQATLNVAGRDGSLPELLKTSSPYTHKWLATQSGELVIGSFDHTQVYSTHASFAALATEMKGVAPGIVAAGEFQTRRGRIVMSNLSGHYKTPYGRLWPVKMHIKPLAGTIKIVRQTYLAAEP